MTCKKKFQLSFCLVGSDKNTKYFHSRATQRYWRNKISGIYNSIGRWCSQPDEIAKSLVDFDQNLFITSNLVICEKALNPIPNSVSDEMNSLLLQAFMEWKVLIALKQMVPLKAPRPNDMPLLFDQNSWSVVGSDVSQTILSYLNTAFLPHPLNHTFLTLIPKVKSLESVSDYRPIRICNVLYKKISKVLANII